MILVLGASGFLGTAFVKELLRQQIPHQAVSRKDCNYCDWRTLVNLLRETHPSFLINAAGFTGQPNVDACESAQAETLGANTLLPLVISHACAVTETRWGHISSGCIYHGAYVETEGVWHLERDLNESRVRAIVEQSPERVRGFREDDPPNFTFVNGSHYSGSKALAEEWLKTDPLVSIWRLRIPFCATAHPRNYLSKLQTYARLYDAVNSLTHLEDFVQAALGLWQQEAPSGIYHLTNPGFVTTRQVVDLIRHYLTPKRVFEYWESDEAFYRAGALAPRSNCVLDTTKVAAQQIPVRPVTEALHDALKNWHAPAGGTDR